MKVFATKLVHGLVEVLVWETVNDFESEECWLDKKFIDILTSDDLKHFDFDPDDSSICFTDVQKQSLRLMAMVKRGLGK